MSQFISQFHNYEN